jgi:hypothetical protein
MIPFATHGLPPLGGYMGSSSITPRNEGHKPATLKEREFKLLDNLKLSGGYHMWMLHQQDALSVWDIQTLVKTVMVDVIVSVGLKGELHCQEAMGVFKARPDIWILTKLNGMPVGVIEVMRPDSNPDKMNDPLIHGQMYDYMLRLQSYYGLKHVFGIVSTYQRWRIYWLPDSEEAARATAIDEELKAEPLQGEIEDSVEIKEV